MRDCLVRLLLFVVLVGGFAPYGWAVKKSELSVEMQALVPKSFIEGVAIKLKSGRIYRGSILSENDTQVKVRYTQGTVQGTKTINLSDIVVRQESDAGPYLVKALMGLELDKAGSQPLHAYRKPVRLLLEFLRKCKGVKGYDAVQARSLVYLREMSRVSQGQERVGETWYTPVQAAVRKYQVYGERITEIERDRKFRSDPELQAQHEKLVDARRQAGRILPKLTQDRAQALVAAGNFLGAADEVNAFIQFWVDEVVAAENTNRRSGRDEAIFAQMDMQYLVSLQREIMDAYLAQGAEDMTPPARVVVPDGMAYVPGGFFLMGADTEDSTDDRFPLHLVYLSAYLIDKYEVSNAQYREFTEFVAKTRESWMEHKDAPPMKKHEPKGWGERELSADNQPVVGVDWFDAYAYATWRKKRLPTEAEWEKGARGREGRLYPWGDEFGEPSINYAVGRKLLAEQMDEQNPPIPPDPAAAFGCSCFKQPPESAPPPTKLPEATWEVDQHLPPQCLQAIKEGMFEWDSPALSPYGLYHMAGNAAEWVNDYYDTSYYAHSQVRDPQGPTKGKVRAYRGGSYRSTKGTLEATWRGQDPTSRRASRRSRRKKQGPEMIGFRCAQSLPEALAAASAGDSIDDASLTELVREMAPHLR
jgi:formylglycine-generating enzyme required for sulfatase activity